MKDLVDKVSRGTRIWNKDEYAKFIKRLSKLGVKRKRFLRLANAEKDEEEEDSWAKRLSFIFGFFYKALWVYTKYLGKRDDWIGHDNDGMIEWDMVEWNIIMTGC